MTAQQGAQRPRRRRWPMMVLLVALIAGATFVWAQVFEPEQAMASGCNLPSASAESTTSITSSSATGSENAVTPPSSGAAGHQSIGTFTDPESLGGTRPANPATVPVRVLNASTVTGQAKTVTDALRSAGFSAIGQQANDARYPNFDLHCYGEIRYGYAGLANARTILMVAPCAQLVRDDRADASVDLVLGKKYVLQPIPEKVRDQLQALTDAAVAPPVTEGHTVAVRSLPPIPPLPDPTNCPASH